MSALPGDRQSNFIKSSLEGSLRRKQVASKTRGKKGKEHSGKGVRTPRGGLLNDGARALTWGYSTYHSGSRRARSAETHRSPACRLTGYICSVTGRGNTYASIMAATKASSQFSIDTQDATRDNE